MVNTAAPSRPQAQRFELGIPDLKLIGALRVLSCSNAQQLLRLLGYSPTSLTYIQTRLKRLADAGYLERLYLPRPSRAGSAPLLYRLTRKSIPVLHAQGLTLPYRLRPSESCSHGYLHLSHTLEVNDVLIAATILARETPRLELVRLMHERELQTEPATVSVAGETQQVAPDGFLDFRHGTGQFCLLLELDRGSHGQVSWKRKVRGLVGLADGSYEERYKTTSLTFMVLVTAGRERAELLTRWTAEELRQLGRQELGELFCCAALDPATSAPRRLFLDPIWSRPFQADQSALLELTPPAQPGAAGPIVLHAQTMPARSDSGLV